MTPWNPPIRAPRVIPTARATIHVRGWSRPMKSGRISTWTRAIVMPIRPSIDPTDRSMFRDTMTRTIPVAMMATEVVWTERFHRLRGVRKVPPDKMWKSTQMTAKAASMPSMRVSNSVALTSEPSERLGRSSRRSGSVGGALVTPIGSWSRPALGAHRHCAGLDALADLLLGDPAGLDDDVEVVLGDRDRGQQDRGHLVPAGGVERLDAADGRQLGALGELDRGLAGGLAELARVLPDRDRLGPQGDPVEGGGVAVLAGDRHLAGEALRLQGGHHAAGHAVVLGEDGVDLVVGLGQELLRLGLGEGWVPVVGVGLADDLDVTAFDRVTDDLLVAVAQEVGVGVGLV